MRAYQVILAWFGVAVLFLLGVAIAHGQEWNGIRLEDGKLVKQPPMMTFKQAADWAHERQAPMLIFVEQPWQFHQGCFSCQISANKNLTNDGSPGLYVGRVRKHYIDVLPLSTKLLAENPQRHLWRGHWAALNSPDPPYEFMATYIMRIPRDLKELENASYPYWPTRPPEPWDSIDKFGKIKLPERK